MARRRLQRASKLARRWTFVVLALGVGYVFLVIIVASEGGLGEPLTAEEQLGMTLSVIGAVGVVVTGWVGSRTVVGSPRRGAALISVPGTLPWLFVTLYNPHPEGAVLAVVFAGPFTLAATQAWWGAWRMGDTSDSRSTRRERPLRADRSGNPDRRSR